MIRAHVRDLVELCVFAREPHAVASLRKLRWKRAKAELERHAERDRRATDPGTAHLEELPDPAPSEEALPAQAPQCESPIAKSRVGKEVGTSHTLDELIAEIQRADVSIKSRQLEGLPSDPLGAISIPCKRDGNSLTLCTLDETIRVLIVLGGRVLQDTAILRPHAAVNKDPLCLERARYTYSNAVYVYDISTRRWRLQECEGTPPQERSDHSALFLAPGYLLVFGGRGRNGQVFRDLYALSLRTWRWWRVDHEHPPMDRYWHAWCMTDAKEVLLFGGKSDALVYGDLAHLRSSAVTRWLDAQEWERRQQSAMAAPFPTVAVEPQRRKPVASPAWAYPRTAGKGPSSRFGMQVVALDNDQVAVVGGWQHGRSASALQHSQSTAADRMLDVYILDTVTLLWTKPQLTSLVCAASCAPSARLLFECFYADQTLVVFGGHTFARNGESEPFSQCPDATRVLFLLDLPRMIWRRLEASEALRLPPAHVHSSGANVVLPQAAAGGVGSYVGLSCSQSFGGDTDLALTAFDLPFER